MGKPDIFGLDMPCMDLNVNLEEIPAPNGGCLVNKMTWQGGGKVSSGMVAAARLGASCAIAGAVGDDIYGRFCYDDFVRHGIVADSMLLRENATTGLSVVLSDKKTNSRRILYRRGTAKALEPEELHWEPLKQARYLFIAETSSALVRQAIQLAKEHRVKIFIDADSYTDSLPEAIPDIDIFIGSEFVFDRLFPGQKEQGDTTLEAACRKLFSQGPQIVVFTFGEKGCIGYSKEGFFSLPAFSVQAEDTVGAGDVFHGAFLAALLQGRDVPGCATYASAASAIKCTRIGGRAGIPNRQVLEHYLKTGQIDYTEIDKRVEYYTRGIG